MTLAVLLLSLVGCGPDVSVSKVPIDHDSDGYDAEVDCDDSHAAVNPDAVEVCDGLDNDCDGDVDIDAADAGTWFPDSDADGTGDGEQGLNICSQPEGFVENGADCDDGDGRVFPGNTEVCDGIDNDCDGAVDDADPDVDGGSTWYADADADRHGDSLDMLVACERPDGYVSLDDDCDDLDARVHPGAVESDCTDPLDYNCDGSVAWADADMDGTPACEDCDDADAARSPLLPERCDSANRDEDCDGVADDDDADVVDTLIWFSDKDGDGYGAGSEISSCDGSAGIVADGSDCDDSVAGVNPGATEVCDSLNVDEDCDGLADDADVGATGKSSYYQDADSDGRGDATVVVAACDWSAGFVPDGTDCNDGDSMISPDAAEVCDAADVDEDCDGLADDADPDVGGKGIGYADVDGDGFGDASSPMVACDFSPGVVVDATDCDDGDASISPAGVEVCNGVDDDCEGTVDGDDAADVATWFRDSDGDLYGDPLATDIDCDQPVGFVPDDDDCDDTDASIHPLSGDATGDGEDSDCDGLDCEADTAGTAYFVACSDSVTWADAQAACLDAGHDGLASILDAAEQATVETLTDPDHEHWIGLNDVASEGTYVWTSGLPVAWTYWGAGEPNAVVPTSDCVELIPSAYFGTEQWNDHPCDATSRLRDIGFVCESR